MLAHKLNGKWRDNLYVNKSAYHIFRFHNFNFKLQMNKVLDAMFERKVAPGEIVIRQGDDGDNFYVIES